jgi:hypothetical protein
MTQSISTNTFGVATLVVSADPTQGNYTTWTAACAAATSGQTIWGRDGTYSENFTLPAGVALAGESNVGCIINGTITISAGGSFDIFNMTLRTNSVNFLSVTGASSATILVRDCYLSATNATGISCANSNAGTAVTCLNCYGGTTAGFAMFAVTAANNLITINSSPDGANIGGHNTTASTVSAGQVIARFCQWDFPVTTSGTGGASLYDVNIDLGTMNAIALTANGTGTHTSVNSSYTSGTASAISIGAGATLSSSGDTISSSNTNAVTGAGTLNYTGMNFSGSSTTINTTTQVQTPAIGTSGQVLTSNGSGAIATFQSAPLVQTVFVDAVAGSTTTSVTMVDVTGATKSITPKSASSKVKVTFSWQQAITNVASTNGNYFAQILRAAVNISGTDGIVCSDISGAGGNALKTWVTWVYIDSPATTSATAYKLQHRVDNVAFTGSSTLVTIILEEIVA